MKRKEHVKFQRLETGEICEAHIGWDAGDVQILITWPSVQGEVKGPFVVEITREDADGIFRRVTDYTLDDEAKDMLQVVRDIAKEMNEASGL